MADLLDQVHAQQTGGDLLDQVHAQSSAADAPKTEDDIIRSYGYDPAVITKAHLYHQGDLKGLVDSPVEIDATGKPGVLSDAVHGFTQSLLGINQLASHGVSWFSGNPADAQYADLLAKVSRDAYAKIRSDPSKVATMAGQMMIPLPGGAAKSVIGAVAKGALTGTAAAAMQPVDVQGPEGSYLGPKLTQTAIGAGTGAATGGVLGGVARGLSSRAVELPEETAARTQTGGAQQVSKLETAMQQTPFAGATDVSRAADAGDRAAIALRDQMNAASTPAQIQQASIGLMNWRTRQTAAQLYDKVDQAVARHPELSDVPLDQTEQTITDALNQALKAKDPDVNLINQLKTFQRTIGASADPAAGDQLVDNSYGQIRKFRSDLGERISTLRTGAGKQLAGPSSAATLQSIRDAVDTDLHNFTSSSAPDVQRAADAADQYYANVRVPFKASDVAKAGAPNLAGTTTDAEADQIFGKFIKAGRGDKAQRFFDTLDPRGRAAVQYQLAADAMNKATDPARGTFNPETFFNALDNTKEAYGVFFGAGPDKALMDGLKNLAQQAVLAADKEAGRAKSLENVAKATGAGAAAAGLAGVHPAALSLGGIATLAGAARGLMLTDAGRRLLADASSMKPGNPALARILDTISRQIPAAGARAATGDR